MSHFQLKLFRFLVDVFVFDVVVNVMLHQCRRFAKQATCIILSYILDTAPPAQAAILPLHCKLESKSYKSFTNITFITISQEHKSTP